MRPALRPGGAAWLMWQDCRIGWYSLSFNKIKDGKTQRVLKFSPGVLLFFLLLAHVAVWPLVWGAETMDPASLLYGSLWWLLGAWAFMFMQALHRAQALLGDRSGLTLLLMAPLTPRSVLATRLGAVMLGVAVPWMLGALALADIGMLFGAWHWLSVFPLLLSLAVFAACAGVLACLALLRLIGPGRMRRFGQLLGALLGLSFVLVSQMARFLDSEALRFAELPGAYSPWRWPLRALQGDGWLLLGALAAAALCYLAAAQGLGRAFTRGVLQMEGSGAPSTRRAGGKARSFVTGLPALARKEWRILQRHPSALVNSLQRVVYLLPACLALFQGEHWAAGVAAFASGLAAMLANGLTSELMLHDQPHADLIQMSPQPARQFKRARMLAVGLPLWGALLALAPWLAWHNLTAAVALCLVGAAGMAGAIGICHRYGYCVADQNKGRKGYFGLANELLAYAMALLSGGVVYALSRIYGA